MDWLNKIITEVEPGEKPPFRAFQLPRLHPYLWDTGTARTLCAACWQGSQRITALTWTWCMAKPGDRLLRACAPTAALAGAGWAVAQHPLAAPGIAAAWLGAAVYFAGSSPWVRTEPVPQPAVQPEPEPAEDTADRNRRTLLRLLDEATAGRNGVHLGELHIRLLTDPTFAGLQRAHMNPLLEDFGVPVQRTLSVDGIEGRSGVRRADVEALLLALPEKEPAPPSQPSESGPDQRESRPLSDHSQPALGPLSGGV